LGDRERAKKVGLNDSLHGFDVEAIFEATIQVLLRHGAEQFTTTRVAERAGVSVGTLYQCYPNKQSLLFAVLERHLNLVIRAVEGACRENHHRPLETMVAAVVHAGADRCVRPARGRRLVRANLGPAAQ